MSSSRSELSDVIVTIPYNDVIVVAALAKHDAERDGERDHGHDDEEETIEYHGHLAPVGGDFRHVVIFLNVHPVNK